MGKSYTYNYILSQQLNGESPNVGFNKWSERHNKIRFMLEGQMNGKEVTSGSFMICSQTKTGEQKIKRELEKMNARYQYVQIYGKQIELERWSIEVDASLEKDKLFVRSK